METTEVQTMKRLTDKELATALRNCSESFIYCNDCPAFEICGCESVAAPTTLLREAADRLEARPVKKGHWIEDYVYDSDPHDRIRYKCSKCDLILDGVAECFTYCPNCGTKMEAGINE